MTAPAFIAAQTVRDYLTLNTDSTSRYSDGTINSNIRTASEFLERATNRYFAAQTGITITATSYGDAQYELPGGVNAVTSVTRSGSVLTVNQSYWLIPNPVDTTFYSAISFGPLGYGYRPPDWFDRGWDLPDAMRTRMTGSLPNDLVIVANVGMAPADYPEQLLMATKIHAAIFTKFPDAALSGVTSSPDGNPLPFADGWAYVQDFIIRFRVGDHSAVSVG